MRLQDAVDVAAGVGVGAGEQAPRRPASTARISYFGIFTTVSMS
jgi:hypothetical protein